MSPEQRAAQLAQIEANKQQYCVNLGAPPGSPNYYDCRKNIEQQLAIEAMQKREIQARQQAMYQQQQQQNYQQQMQTISSFNSANRSRIHCTSNEIGNTVNTDCY